MALDGVASRDRVNCDVGGGWEDGNTIQRAGEYGDSNDVPDYASARISGHPEFTTESNEVSPWVWVVGGFVLGGLVVGLIVMIRFQHRE